MYFVFVLCRSLILILVTPFLSLFLILKLFFLFIVLLSIISSFIGSSVSDLWSSCLLVVVRVLSGGCGFISGLLMFEFVPSGLKWTFVFLLWRMKIKFWPEKQIFVLNCRFWNSSFSCHCRGSKVRLRAPPALHIQRSKLNSLYSLDLADEHKLFYFSFSV